MIRRGRPTVFFLISSQHLIPTGGIGSFFRGFARMARELGWPLTCILDKGPSPAAQSIVGSLPERTFIWPRDPKPYTKPPGTPRFGVGVDINQEMIENFKSAMHIALHGADPKPMPDMVLVNTPEAIEAPFGEALKPDTKIVFYSHHENMVVPPEDASAVFSPSYNAFLYGIAGRNGVIVATQSKFNVQRMERLKFSSPPVVLPMPLSDHELLVGDMPLGDGVLFIGRHEPRKNPKRFAEKVAAAGLRAKVLTNKRGEAKFEKTLRDVGVVDFEIKSELTGKAKADFIKSARVAFHPASLESYGYSAMETLAAGLPTVCIEEYEWWQAFADDGVRAVPSRKVQKYLATLHDAAEKGPTDPAKWIKREARTLETWREFMMDRSDPIRSEEVPEWNETEWRSTLPTFSSDAPHERTDYSRSMAFTSNVAIYAPAISAGYVGTLERRSKTTEKIGGRFSSVDLQFTNPETKLFFYPWALYSAGQAASTGAAAKKDSWLTRRPRDPRVVVLGDSGGYQVQQGTIKFTSETTGQMLNWLERVADYSMILDFPTGGISRGALRKHIERLTEDGHDIEKLAAEWGFSPGFVACVIQTEINNKEFVRRRSPGATKLLNVIQGRNEAESSFWYQRMKHFPFEGWSFAGKHHTQLSMTLRRLVDMSRDGLLATCPWIHFLGISTLKAGMVLSFLQRALRESGYAPNVQISFDSSSPVMAASNGYQAVVGFDRSPDRWNFRTEKIALADYLNSDRTIWHIGQQWREQETPNRMTVSTYVGNTVPLREMITPRDTRRPTLSQEQLALLIHHNTQAYIEGFRHAYRYLDDGAFSDRPEPLRHFQSLLRTVFSSDDPMTAVDELEPQLDALMLEQV